MKAIVFDMDGVLFDTERLCMNIWHEMARERNMEHMDRVVFLDQGRLVLDGSPAELEISSSLFRNLLAFDRGAQDW